MNKIHVVTIAIAAILVGLLWLPGGAAQAFEQLPRSLAWELIAQSGEKKYNSASYPYAVHYAQAGDTVEMWATVKNWSRNPRAQMWYGQSSLLNEGPNYPNAHAIGVGTWDPMDHQPTFLDPSSFVVNGNRLVYYDGPAINRGQTVTIRWKVKIAANTADGIYDLPLALVRELDEWGYRVTPSGANHRYRSMLYQFVVGDYVAPVGYQTYDTPYRFAFNYKLGSQDSLIISDKGADKVYQDYGYKWSAIVGMPDSGSAHSWVRVWDLRQDQLIVPIDKARVEAKTDVFSTATVNGISWTIFKWHEEYADANVERRIGQLPDGTIVEIESQGWFKSDPDQNFLNSVRTT